MNETENLMIGRKVTGWQCSSGEIIRWTPLSASLCDVLILLENGTECWFSSDSLKPVDDKGPLLSRNEFRRTTDKITLKQLQQIRDDLIRDFNKPWPGMEFGKAHMGIALNQAITTTEISLGYYQATPEIEIPTSVKLPTKKKNTKPDIDLGLFS